MERRNKHNAFENGSFTNSSAASLEEYKLCCIGVRKLFAPLDAPSPRIISLQKEEAYLILCPPFKCLPDSVSSTRFEHPAMSISWLSIS